MAKLINHINQPIILDYWNYILPGTVECQYLYKGYIGNYVLFPNEHSKLPYALELDNCINKCKMDLENCIDYDVLPEMLKSFYRVMTITGNTDIPDTEDEEHNLIKLMGVNWQSFLKKILKHYPVLDTCVTIKPYEGTLISVHSAYIQNIKRLANGKITTNYSNGKKNCVATFRDGKIIGNYKQYDRITGKCTMTKKIKKAKAVMIKCGK